MAGLDPSVAGEWPERAGLFALGTAWHLPASTTGGVCWSSGRMPLTSPMSASRAWLDQAVNSPAACCRS